MADFQLYTKLVLDTSGFNKGVATSISQTKKFSTGVSRLKKMLGGLGITLSAYQGIRLFKAAIKETHEFETALADMRKVTNRSFTDLRNDIKGISPVLGDSTSLMKGYYQVISAGVTEPKKALELLTTASKTAKAAHLDQSEVIKGITKIMAGYGDEIKTTSQAADLLFTIEKVGQTTVAELVPIIGGLSAVSKELGITHNEMGAALAQTTQFAGSTAEAATRYQAVLTGLIKPSEAMIELFENMGGTQAAIKELGFAGVLEEIQKATGGSTEALGELFGRKEAVLGFLSLAKESFSGFRDRLGEVEKKAGALNTAFGTWEKTFQATKERFDTTIKLMLRELGQELMPEVQKQMNTFSDWVKENKKDIENFFKVVGKSVEILAKGVALIGKISTENLKAIKELMIFFRKFHNEQGASGSWAEVSRGASGSWEEAGEAIEETNKEIVESSKKTSKIISKEERERRRVMIAEQERYLYEMDLLAEESTRKEIRRQADMILKQEQYFKDLDEIERKKYASLNYYNQSYWEGVKWGWNKYVTTELPTYAGITVGIFKSMTDTMTSSMSTLFYNISEGSARTSEIWANLLDNMKKILFDAVAEMIKRWLVLKMTMAAGEYFGMGGGGNIPTGGGVGTNIAATVGKTAVSTIAGKLATGATTAAGTTAAGVTGAKIGATTAGATAAGTASGSAGVGATGAGATGAGGGTAGGGLAAGAAAAGTALLAVAVIGGMIHGLATGGKGGISLTDLGWPEHLRRQFASEFPGHAIASAVPYSPGMSLTALKPFIPGTKIQDESLYVKYPWGGLGTNPKYASAYEGGIINKSGQFIPARAGEVPIMGHKEEAIIPFRKMETNNTIENHFHLYGIDRENAREITRNKIIPEINYYLSSRRGKGKGKL